VVLGAGLPEAMKRSSALAFLLLGVGVLNLTAVRNGSAVAQGGDSRLSLTQIEQLISIRTPDAVVAKEIHDRGIGFSVNERLLDGLRKRGAGPKTIQALSHFVVMASLEVFSAPTECDVVVDGILRGHTGAQGILVLADLKPGVHEVILRKENYKEWRSTVSLAANAQEQLNATLTWAGGFLTVLTGATGVSIEIEGMGRFSDEVTDLPCLPGTYTITVSGSKYQTATKTVEVVAGQGATVSIHLEPDPEFVQRKVAELQDQYASRNYPSVIGSAPELLSVDRNNKDALRLLAQSYFLTNDFEKFKASAKDVLDAGGYIQIQLNHHHLGYFLHPVMLSISANSLSFDPQTSDKVHCSYKPFSNPVAAIVQVALSERGNNELFLNLRIQDPRNPKKVLNLNFADLESHFVEAQKGAGGIIAYTGHVLISRSEAEQALRSVAEVLKRVAPTTR